MSTSRDARWARPALAVNWALLGFITVYLSILVLSFAAVWTLDSRLPVDARNVASSSLEAELVTIAMYLAWIALPHRDRMQYALETVLPIGLVLVGFYVAELTATLLFKLDAAVFRMPLASVSGLALIVAGALVGSLLGRYLRGLAVSGRLRREAASSRRSAWFAETSPDGSWRTITGTTYGVVALAMILWVEATSGTHSPGSAMPFELLVAGVWAFAVVVGDHATTSITDAAVKVRTRLLSNSMGWSVSLSEIASARAIAARPEPLRFDRNRIVLRTGPALEIKTLAGGRYSVSLDEADEAVAVIEALRSNRSPDASELSGEGMSLRP